MFKIQKENISDLFNLMNQYPDLSVVPILEQEVYVDYDCREGYVAGSLGRCFVDEYLLIQESHSVFLKSDYDVENVMDRYFFYEDYHKLMEENADCEQIYNALPWEKAILVFVDFLED